MNIIPLASDSSILRVVTSHESFSADNIASSVSILRSVQYLVDSVLERGGERSEQRIGLYPLRLLPSGLPVIMSFSRLAPLFLAIWLKYSRIHRRQMF